DSDIELVLGAAMREGQEDQASQDHVPFIARKRMREVNFFGLDLSLDINISDEISFDLGDVAGFTGPQGHTSGDLMADVANIANLIDFFDSNYSFTRAWECILSGCSLNDMNLKMAETMGIIAPIVVDDHWDGAFEDTYAESFFEIYPPGQGQADAIEYVVKVYAEGAEEGVPRYDWQVDLDNVGIPHYHYSTAPAQSRLPGSSRETNDNFFRGPSIGVVGVKAAGDVNSIRGLGTAGYPEGIGNGYSMTALSRSQVYYLKNPNRADEQPSLFNPHWVPRLAPLAADDVPALLRQGLPFVMGHGSVLEPTH
ncbi:MAG: hypothetical protein KDD44_04825, partial [Bdellovibrionales bacterium]|nr:hypothetical protein [Bdellovibrionales bacterium]